MPDSYIVRFKVVSLECASMRDGQQYIVTYHRGETYRSTPCYVAQGGAVDFSQMPEGAALVHFKSGGPRFQPKWIKFRVEEYIRGQPRRTIGETQVDCAEVLGLRNVSASAIRRASLEMYGVMASMSVALLVCPQGHPLLSFDSLLPAARETKGANPSPRPVPTGAARRMARGEGMALLISLEAMLERRREKGAAGADSALERRLAELEERRRALTGVEGMATTAVRRRAEDVVAAQFTALARKYRNNYIGEVAAYMRQMALTSGVPISDTLPEDNAVDPNTLRDQLQRTNARIETLTQQLRKLEEEKAAFARIRERVNVSAELAAVVAKMETVQSQLQMLEKSRGALEDAACGRDADGSPVVREVRDMRARIQSLAAEEEQLRERIRRMTAVAAGHALKWARAKNPPREEVRQSIDSLFGDKSKDANTSAPIVTNDLRSAQRKQIIDALAMAAQQKDAANQKPDANYPSAPMESSSSDGESSPTRRPNAKDAKPPDMFGAEGLPSMGDFGAPAPPQSTHADPFVTDLNRGMFATKPTSATESKTAAPPVFDFGAVIREDGAGVSGNAGGKMFTLEAFPAALQTNAVSSGPLGYTSATTVEIEEDPMYDFKLPVESNQNVPVSVEFGGSGLFGTYGNGGYMSAAAPVTSNAAPPRPTFAFGPDDHGGEEYSKAAVPALPTYSFENDTPAKGSGATSRLPTYDFGS